MFNLAFFFFQNKKVKFINTDEIVHLVFKQWEKQNAL